jgi:uncharacterized protein YjlB
MDRVRYGLIRKTRRKAQERPMNPERFLLDRNGWVPNNQHLPVLIDPSVERGDRKQIAEAFEKLFADHGWPAK